MFIPCKIFSLAIFLLSFPFCLNLHLIVSAARSIISTKHSIYDYWSGRTDWSQHIILYSSPAYLRYTGHEEARRWWMLDIPHKCRHNYTHYRLLPPTFGPELNCTLGKLCTVWRRSRADCPALSSEGCQGCRHGSAQRIHPRIPRQRRPITESCGMLVPSLTAPAAFHSSSSDESE